MLHKCYKIIILTLSLLAGYPLFASARKPMETFIMQVQQTNKFTTISNIWQADQAYNTAKMMEKVEKAQPLLIDYTQVASLLAQKPFAIDLVVPGIGGGSYTIELARYDFTTSDFSVFTNDGSGKDKKFNYTPGVYYRGIVKGIEGSLAAFSFFNNEVYGIFSIPGEGNYNLVPNIMEGKYYNSNIHYVLYNDNDLKIKDLAPKCQQDALPEVENRAARTTTKTNNDVFNNCTEIRVFEVGDYALYQTKGASTTNVTNFLMALFNNQSTLYRNEGIMIALKYIQVNTATDNYQHISISSSGPFLDTFGHVTQNNLHGCDVAILASTALNGGYGALGGVAWLKSMCAAYQSSNFFGPYGFCDLDNSAVTNFPTFSWDVNVMTHEMGHIVGSPHTHRCCWNPPGTGRTAIDSCYTLEGSCHAPTPAFPVGGGTIMSYCHLTSDGINFANGFGPQPSDTVKYFIAHTFSSTCGATYNPSVSISHPAKFLAANRECTDMASGITYYWNDNNTADQTDDSLVLMIKKNGGSIGTLDSAGFTVASGTIASYGGGTGQGMALPAGIPGLLAHNMGMRRYWKMTSPVANVSSPIEIMFPFMSADTSDIHGSVLGPALPLSAFKMYDVKSTIDPNPANGFTGSTASNFAVYSYGTTTSTSVWSFSNIGTTFLAHMLTATPSGGGTGFYSYNFAAGINNVTNGGEQLSVYPNPTNDIWFFLADNVAGKDLTVQIFAADGKLMLTQLIATGVSNVVDAAQFPAGVYYYRVIGTENTFNGTLLKN